MVCFHATRLAPSPTGALHLGHARTFLITWLFARQAGAKIHMRMEDIDSARAKPEAVQQAYDDLHWLGLDWDPYAVAKQEARSKPQEVNTESRPAGALADIIEHSAFSIQHSNEVVQSSRLWLYQNVLETLWQRHLIYPCICTRADIAAAVAASASAPHEAEVPYPGTCRHRFPTFADSGLDTLRTAADIRASTGKAPCFRLRLAQNAPTSFTDLFAGPQSANVAQTAGDFPLTRFATPQIDNASLHSAFSIQHSEFALPPAYQLACVADDHAMAIDLVIRGDDLLPSTPRQLLLYHALSWQPPRFAHIPLVVGPDGKRLAKRHGESRISQFRNAGVSPRRIVGWAAWRSGQFPTPREITPQDLLATFDPTRIPNSRITLTPEDLAWLT
jgi:glutamyl-tRNA synthetase